MADKNKVEQLNSIFILLKFTFAALCIIAGLDKFSDLIVNWNKYLGQPIINFLPVSAAHFMMVVGVFEIIIGIIIFEKPKIGGYIVAIWLVLISLELLTTSAYMDIAVRDLVMAICAFAMARMSNLFIAFK